MQHNNVIKAISKQFPYQPTNDQAGLINKISAFIRNDDPDSAFMLKGYAGTGKTTIISSLVQVLPALGADAVLLAPTGRAAKVLAGYSGQKAYTIHKKIYRLQSGNDGSIKIVLRQNKHKNTFFVVDEASMIAWGSEPAQGNLFGGANLLDDLMQFVYNRKNCRLILIGDTAQLPPVHIHESPALNSIFLEKRYNIHISEHELKEVVRQAENSGILFNATHLRDMLRTKQTGFPRFRLDGFNDFVRAQGQEAAEQVDDAYISHGREEALMICRSNKRANMYNRHIRQRVLFMEEEINAGDLLMVVKNNYFWLPEDSDAGFIANGDIIELKRILRTESLYGFRFADVSARMLDYPDQDDLEVKVLLDTLDADGPSLTQKDANKLFEAIAADYAHIPNKRNRIAQIKNSPHLNALQVKYAYAMTCHKAQGGQWKNVFVEMGYIPDKKPDTEYLRWLYTAITRSTGNVFLLNFSDDFFEESQ